MYENLFSPIKIRRMSLKNRVVFPAACTHMSAKDGSMTEKLIHYHEARALGGCALNILEATNVLEDTAAPGFPGIYSDTFISGLKKLTETVHEAGGKCGVQLWEGGLAAALQGSKKYLVPSDYQSARGLLKAASREEIQEAVEGFGEASRRAVEAGFDCVEFHAAHNYSPHMFLSAAFNQRKDEYGGSLENRARYALECIREIRRNVPEDFPVLIRIDAKDDCLENGLTLDDMADFCKMAKAAGVDAINVSRGNIVSSAVQYEVPSIDIPKAFNVENAAYLKEKTGLLTIATGRINAPELADKIIKDGKADMVVIGRGQICDPDFCKKASEGRPEDIVRCIACNQGCYDRLSAPNVYEHISCLRNPAVGREGEPIWQRAEQPKRVVVIGGGMGGMEAAIMAQRRGHHVTLLEKSDHLGGQFLLAGMAPRKREMYEAAVSRGEQLKRSGVTVRMQTTADAELLDELRPEVIINAAGGVPIQLKVPGAERETVYSGFDILSGETELKNKKVIVIGGGLVGLEVAEYLSEKQCEVTVVEMREAIAMDIGHGRKVSVMENIRSHQIKEVVETTCCEITENGIKGRKGDQEIEVKGDAVVIAIGSRSRDMGWLETYSKEKEIPLYTIGDAKKTRRAIDAIHEGAEIAAII